MDFAGEHVLHSVNKKEDLILLKPEMKELMIRFFNNLEINIFYTRILTRKEYQHVCWF